MQVRPRVAWQSLNGEVVILDLEGRRVLGLNEAGSFLWPRLCDHTEEQLTDALAGAYGIERPQAASDVAAFLELLTQRGFVAP